MIPTTLKDLLRQAPSDTNPFSFVLQILNQSDNPTAPAYTFPILIIFAVVYGFLIISCVIIIALPLLQGQASRERRYWLFRKKYSPES